MLLEKNDVFGEDIFFTFILCFGILNSYASGLIYYNKFIHFQQKKIAFSVSAEKRINRLKRFQLLLAKIFFAEFTLRAIYALIAGYYLTTVLLTELYLLTSGTLRDFAFSAIDSVWKLRLNAIMLNLISVAFGTLPLLKDELMSTWIYLLPSWVILSALATNTALSWQKKDRKNPSAVARQNPLFGQEAPHSEFISIQVADLQGTQVSDEK
eukprot:snap_masked-scaffold_1-processed-gene-4.25-mRNA-1 protein AED:1.00 eAED:1.00 QI:0/0/0/0/1/1/2/0/210